MSDYPKWIYPPDGGKGKVIHGPDEQEAGWLDTPSGPQAADGERIIGQPTEFAVPDPPESETPTPAKSKKK